MGLKTIVSVVTAASSVDLLTLADLKADLNISGTDQDVWLSRCIRRASTYIANYCNRVLVQETVREQIFPDRDAFPYQVPNARDTIGLTRWPIISVTSLTEHDHALTKDTDFLVEPDAGQLIRLQSVTGLPMSWNTWPLVVVYSAGYASIPADLQDACSRLVKKMDINRVRDTTVKSEEVSGISRTEWWVPTGADGGNIPPDVADLIDNYRVPVTA